MRVRQITFDEDSEPVTATFELTIPEAALIARSFGRLTHTEQETVMPGGGEHGSNVYDGLVDGLFNRFWDDGVDEAIKGFKR